MDQLREATHGWEYIKPLKNDDGADAIIIAFLTSLAQSHPPSIIIGKRFHEDRGQVDVTLDCRKARLHPILFLSILLRRTDGSKLASKFFHMLVKDAETFEHTRKSGVFCHSAVRWLMKHLERCSYGSIIPPLALVKAAIEELGAEGESERTVKVGDNLTLPAYVGKSFLS